MSTVPNVALLNVEEAAQYLRLSVKTLRNWCYRGQVPYVKLGGSVRFRLADLEAWIESSMQPAS